MIAEALARVTRGEQLERAEMSGVIRAVMQGEGSEIQIAGLLAALRTRGETLEELVGAAQAMRALALPLPEAAAGAVDTCGTGGDGAGTFNISTVAAIVVAGAGAPVAKHGNRAATSRCGSAELLEALGVSLAVGPERMAEAVTEVGIGFLFARDCHPAMARVAPIRAALGVPTLFNRLGPLTNPMRVRRHLLGVASGDHMDEALMALVELGATDAWVVHGEDGLDEISSCAPTRVCRYRDGEIERLTLAPGDYVAKAEPAALLGGDVEQNAAIASAILAGESGAKRDVVVLNAGAALCVAGRAADLGEGILQAEQSLDSGAARDCLERWIAFTASRTSGS